MVRFTSDLVEEKSLLLDPQFDVHSLFVYCRSHVNGFPSSATPSQLSVRKCRVELEKTRLLVLEAADQLDRLGNKEARGTIAMAKVAAPAMALQVLDMAMQVHGALGLSSDSVLSHLWATARTIRIADGPDEVHLGTIAKVELQKSRL